MKKEERVKIVGMGEVFGSESDILVSEGGVIDGFLFVVYVSFVG